MGFNGSWRHPQRTADFLVRQTSDDQPQNFLLTFGQLTVALPRRKIGGVAGWDAAETDDEDPDRLAVTLRMTAAYLRSALDADDPAWVEARAALTHHAAALGRVEERVSAIR